MVIKIGGVDIHINRTDSIPKYIWVWTPDSLGSITGFVFSGFTSAWSSRPLTINGVAGKIFSAPNKTATKDVTFEVRV